MSASIGTFLAALRRTLQVMDGPESASGPVEQVSASGIRADVSAHLSVFTDRELCIILTANEAAALTLVRSITGLDLAFDDSLTADTLGELLNVLVGSAQKGSGFQFSLPVIAKARGHQVKVLTPRPCERVVSTLGEGELGLYLVEGRVADDATAPG